MSLLLKVLEGETDESLSAGRCCSFNERRFAQPGRKHQVRQFADRARLFLRPADPRPRGDEAGQSLRLGREFPEAMKAGGFDCVIGNPPWLMAGYYLGDEIEYLRGGTGRPKASSTCTICSWKMHCASRRRPRRHDRPQQVLPHEGRHGTPLHCWPTGDVRRKKSSTSAIRRCSTGQQTTPASSAGSGFRAGVQIVRAKAGFAVQVKSPSRLPSLTPEPWHFEERNETRAVR